MELVINFFTDSTAQWVVAIATIFLALVALWGETFKNIRNRPIIKVAIGNQMPELIPMGGYQIFRMRVVNEGKTTAKNCHAKIISVMPESPIPNFYFEPDSLKWSSAPRDMNYRINSEGDINKEDITQLTPIFREFKDILPNKGWEFCDLFEANNNGYIIFVSSGKRPSLTYYQKAIVTIEIFGDNIKPKRVKFRISPTQDFWVRTRIDRVDDNYSSQSDCKQDTSEEAQHSDQPHSESEDY